MPLNSAMAMLGPAASAKRNRRRHARVQVRVLGRYMLSDRTEYPCQTVNMSPGGIALFAPVKGDVGERVVLYLDEIGRLEGQIVRMLPEGFAVRLNLPAAKREKLADQLTWLANQKDLGMAEDRRHERIEPINNMSAMTTPDGLTIAVKIVDVSISGAMIESEIVPEKGAIVTIGSTRGRVLREKGAGFALEFVRLMPADSFDEHIIL
jgi:hypothetical protein